MSKKPTKLLGLPFTDFISLDEKGEEIHLQPARLLPSQKAGDEKALTSIFLSSLRLVKEFRKDISSRIGLTQGGQIHVFKEVQFSLFDRLLS